MSPKKLESLTICKSGLAQAEKFLREHERDIERLEEKLREEKKYKASIKRDIKFWQGQIKFTEENYK